MVGDADLDEPFVRRGAHLDLVARSTVYLTAFVSRFMTTWRIRSRSPRTLGSGAGNLGAERDLLVAEVDDGRGHLATSSSRSTSANE